MFDMIETQAKKPFRRSFDVTRVLAVVLLLASVSIGVYAILAPSTQTVPLALWSVVLILLGAVFGAMCIRILSTASQASQSPGEMFDGMFGSATTAKVLTTGRGDILAENDPCRKDAAFIWFSEAVTGKNSRASELLKQASLTGTASEVVETPSGARRLTAERLDSDCILWGIHPVSSEDLYTSIFETLPCITVSKKGEVIAFSAAAQELAGGSPEGPESLVEEDKVIPGAIHAAARAGNGQMRVEVIEAENGDVTYLGLPAMAQVPRLHAEPDQILESLPVAVARLDGNGTLMKINSAARALLGPEAQTGVKLNTIVEGLGRTLAVRVQETMSGQGGTASEIAHRKLGDQDVYLKVGLTRIEIEGQPFLLAVFNDATELKALEMQFVQSQKMQAVGQLAGGVAHDFNNLLTAINGHCDLLLLRHESGDGEFGDLTQIRQNANRAAALVRQLLAFSRKQTLRPKVLDLLETLSELSHLLNRLLGEKVKLNFDHGRNLHQVRVDERQLEQVIMNLVVNARDAMKGGGQVNISTANFHLTEQLHRDQAVVPPGHYVRIEVTDTGTGIPEDKVSQIFEPFFTTKAQGEGTGLGLSTVYGIVKQTGGFIFVDSVVGEGTTFTIYLPSHNPNADRPVDVSPIDPAETESNKDLSGRGVVLLVEDEAPVRAFTARALNMRGYTVIEAESAEDALETLKDDDLEVDVVVSDVVMPGKNGPTWVREAQSKLPNARVIFVSGYAEDAFLKGEPEVPNSVFLPKPFSLKDISEKVKEQMEARHNNTA